MNVQSLKKIHLNFFQFRVTLTFTQHALTPFSTVYDTTCTDSILDCLCNVHLVTFNATEKFMYLTIYVCIMLYHVEETE